MLYSSGSPESSSRLMVQASKRNLNVVDDGTTISDAWIKLIFKKKYFETSFNQRVTMLDLLITALSFQRVRLLE